MSLEQTSERRSMDYDAAIGHDKTTTGPTTGEYNSANVRDFHKCTLNTSGDGSNGNTNKTVTADEEKLRNAMHHLRIVSVEQLQFPPNTIMCRDDLSLDKNAKVNNYQAALTENTLPGDLKPTMEHMNYKALKLLQTKRTTTTIARTPLLVPKRQSRVDISINQSTSKHVIKTISNTGDGIRLKEERINFFGIPVTTNHKKRTQVKPFNFQSRTKKSQQLQKSSAAFTVPSKSEFHSNNMTTKIKTVPKPSHYNTKINGAIKTSSNAVVSQNTAQTINEVSPSDLEHFSRENITLKKSKPEISKSFMKTNKENHIPDNVPIGSQERKSKCTILHPKAEWRHQFKAKMKKRELEIEEMRANVERKRRDKEKF